MVLEGGSSKLWSTAIDGETGATGWTIADVGHEKANRPHPRQLGGLAMITPVVTPC